MQFTVRFHFSANRYFYEYFMSTTRSEDHFKMSGSSVIFAYDNNGLSFHIHEPNNIAFLFVIASKI